MILILHAFAFSLLGARRFRRNMALRILVLEHQFRVLKRTTKRPHLTDWDRALWVAISRTWSQWRAHLHLVRPETVVDWRRRRFRRYWTRKSQRMRTGRPSVPVEIRQLIRKLARANSLWGAPRIHAELLKLDIEISQATVAKYMPRRSSSAFDQLRPRSYLTMQTTARARTPDRWSSWKARAFRQTTAVRFGLLWAVCRAARLLPEWAGAPTSL